MLVLSRKEADRILFPNLGITVQILRVDGNRVRVGVEAPPEVKVLRHELALENLQNVATSRQSAPSTHDRNLLGATKALAELYDLSERDLDERTEKLIFDIFHHLKEIDERISQPATGGQQNGSPAPHSGYRRALLVEDNANEAHLLAGYLRTKDFEVHTAADGRVAIDYLRQNSLPDVVLLDMQMPRMDGAATIRNVRANPSHQSLKVFAVSGGAPADYGVEIGPNGVDGWFPKPLDPEAMVFRLAFDIGSDTDGCTAATANEHDWVKVV